MFFDRPFSAGFSNGFGPLSYSFCNNTSSRYINKDNIMASIILQGANASGVFKASPQIYFNLRDVQLDLPGTHIGSYDIYITVSGSRTGAYTFYGDQKVNIPFKANEDVYFTTNLSGTHSAIINYTTAGDMKAGYLGTNESGWSGAHFSPTFWRYS